jgi:hypothetical protein
MSDRAALPGDELLTAFRRLAPAEQRRVALELLSDCDGRLFVAGRWDLSEPGAAAWDGQRFSVAGAERRLLARLVRARGAALPCDVLKAALGNPDLEPSTLRGIACRLRRLLRDNLTGIPADPLRCIDRMGYRLDVPA